MTGRLALTILALCLAGAEASALPDPSAPWLELSARDFTYYSALSEKHSLKIARELERFRYELFGGREDRLAHRAVPTRVFLFETPEDLDEYSPLPGRPGWFTGGFDVNVLALAQSKNRDPMPVVYHEYIHYFLQNNYSVLPLWLNEGLAEFYSTYEERRKEVHIGRPILPHLHEVRSAGVVPLGALFSTTTSSEHYNEANRAGPFYALSWLITHYLLMEEENGQTKLAEFLLRLEAGEDHDAALTAALGYDVAALQERVYAYAERPSLNYRTVEKEGGDGENTFTVRELSPAETLAHLGELLIHGGDRQDDARRHLEEALELDPSQAVAWRGLGALQFEREEPDSAIASYRRAIELAPHDYLSRFYLGYLLLERQTGRRMAIADPAQPLDPEIEEARVQLRGAATLNPEFLESQVRFAYTWLYDPGDPAPAIRTLRSLCPRLPSRTDIRHNLVLLWLKAGDYESADRFIESEAKGVLGPERTVQLRGVVARTWLNDAVELAVAGDYDGARDVVARIRATFAGRRLPEEAVTAMERVDTGSADARHLHDVRGDFARYEQAKELSLDGKHRKALTILDELLASEPEPALRSPVEELRDVCRYNVALNRYKKGDYREALSLAREVAATASDESLADASDRLVKACRSKMR